VKDFNVGDVVDLKFTSVSSGVATALLSGVIDVYKNNSTAESTEGVTLTSTFAEVVGFNHVRIETTADSTFYSAASKFLVMLSAGTVDGNSVAGYSVGGFSLRLGTIDDIADGTTMLSTDADDIIATSTAIVAESTATAAVVDSIAAGTTTLSTDVDDLITEATAHTTSLQLLTSATTTLSTDIDDLLTEATAHSTDLEALTSASSRLEAEATSHTTTLQLLTSATTTLSTDIDDLISTTTAIVAESTATAAVVDSIAAGTTSLSTDADDLIATTTAIFADTNSLDGTKIPDTISLNNINAEVDTALVDGGLVHQVTTISSLTSQTVFDLAAGSTSDSAYVGDYVVITDASNATDKAVGLVSAYNGAGKQITLAADPGIFAMSTNDLIAVVPVSRALPAALADGAGGLPISDAGGLDLDGLTSETSGIAAGTTMLSTDLDDLITETTLIRAESTATAAVVDGIASGTTMLSTDLDDLIATSTLIAAESTATAAVVDLIGAETSGLTTSVEQLTSASSRLEAEATSHTTTLQLLTSATTTLSTDIDDLLSEATAHTTTLEQLTSASSRLEVSTTAIMAGTTALSTDIADIWATTITELSSAMNSTPTVLDILAFQHMAAWNQRVTTGTSGYDIIYNDAGSTVFVANITEPTTASFQRAQYTT
jgi:hypothetical protein